MHCVNKCKNAWFYIQWSWPIFFYFYWKLQKHSTWDNVLENLIQQLVFLPREILQCGGRKSILMKLLVCLCLQIQTKAVASDRLKLQTSGRLATIFIFISSHAHCSKVSNIQIHLIFDGLDLVSKEIIENNFNDKKEIKANIWAEAFRDAVPLSKLNSWQMSH